ncbi:MAG: bifunctional oligoribonuclease/PAP phosphatase NrnA [Patescibacteria group bacterium]
MENSLKFIIDQSNSTLILLPENPFFDQVAAGLGLYLAIRDKKEISISTPTQLTVEFNRLVGVNKISSELGNKNLVIRFTDYKASDIERVSYDIENREFRLSVIPKPGLSAPKQDQARLSYSGISADTAILVGGVNESHFPVLSTNSLAGAKLVHVGTRNLTLSGGKSVVSLSKPTSSISELVASLIKESGLSLDGDIATNLLMGIEEGTSKFSSSEVTADTFSVVSELMRAGGQRGIKTQRQKAQFPPGSIPGQLSRQAPQLRQQQSGTQPRGDNKQGAPKDWLEPKIYKGTSIS